MDEQWSKEKEVEAGANSTQPAADDAIRPAQNVDESNVPPQDSTETSSKTLNSTPSHVWGRESGAGTWGEAGTGDVRASAAMDDYQEMQKELSHLAKTQSRKSDKSRRSHSRDPSRPPGLRDRILTKTSTNRSARLHRERSKAQTEGGDVEAGGEKEISDAEISDDEPEFDIDDFMRNGRFEKRTADGGPSKRVGVVFKDLTVVGMGAQSRTVKTLPDAVLGTFGPDLYRIICYFIPALAFVRPSQTRNLIRDFTGVVRDGEMMLVLGRPGSGCSTFLKAIANERAGYLSVKGDVSYGGITAADQGRRYRGEVIYNEEDDLHLAQLTVWQTLQFTLWNKTKRRFRREVDIIGDALLRMFAMTHTKNTPVGSAMVPGVSGGERKRVSIIETLATRSSVTCWDNSTRGLDASTALDYAKSLRIMTDVSRRTTLVTLYQAGQEIYELMDKVLVVEDGRMIFQGRADEARQYFIGLGFYSPERQTTADFLTSVGDPNERQFRKGMEDRCPKTPADLEKAFKESKEYQKVLADVQGYEAQIKESEHAAAKDFQSTVKESKSNRTVPSRSNYTVSFWKQVLACTRREFWLMMGDRSALYSKIFIIISCGLIVGSLFYGQPETTQGAFSRGGTVFFSILFLGWLQLSELMKAVTGRNVVARHRQYAFYRPSAVILARVLNDFPILLIEVVIFGIIMYFMTGLALEPGKFFIYLLFIYVTTINITALYRMLASLSPTIDDAVRFSGVTLNLLIVFTGYVIPKPVLLGQKIWFGCEQAELPLIYHCDLLLSRVLLH